MSRVTLEELLKEVGVSPTQVDKACTSEHLQDIALFLESWRTVVPHLGLSRIEVEEVEQDGRGEKEKRQKILEVWKAGFAFKAKYVVLIKALLKIGRADQAEQVCRLLVPQQANEGNLYHEYMGGSIIGQCIRAQCASHVLLRLSVLSPGSGLCTHI